MTAPADPLVAASGVTIGFGRGPVLADVDLSVSRGAHLAVTGRSGSGKSTLLLALAGLLAPDRGAVAWPGLDADPAVRRGQIGVVFQAPSLMPELTALQNVSLPLRLRGVPRDVAESRAARSLEQLTVVEIAHALPEELSGGQQQRVAIARVLAGEHRLVLADEPTGALDRVNAHLVTGALRDLVTDTGGALVLATHDPELADLMDERVEIDEGRLLKLVSP